MPNDNRPVDLLRDPKGVYGIGITHEDVREQESSCYEHLILRSDVLADSAVFPIENRETLLHTLPKHCFMSTYEWKLHEVMVAEAFNGPISGGTGRLRCATAARSDAFATGRWQTGRRTSYGPHASLRPLVLLPSQTGPGESRARAAARQSRHELNDCPPS